MLGGGLVVLLAAGVGLLAWFNLLPRSQPPLAGDVTLVIRPADAREFLLLEERGALPVRAGGQMSLQVDLTRPLCVYLLWIDSEGKVTPLYPWNNDKLTVTDANELPPGRRPSKVVLSPTIGGGWPFGRRGGLETIVLLARATPLGADAALGTVFASLPATRMRHQEEVGILGLDRGKAGVSSLVSRNRGTEEEAREVDAPLVARLEKLRDQFEIIRVVRVAHAGD